jgi:capsular polysaccharide transport system permease protein
VLRRVKIKHIFSIFTTLAILYVLIIKTNLYLSNSSVLIKNIDGSTQTSSLFGILSGQSNNTLQDAMVVKEYLQSYEMYNKFDEKYKLSKHYRSDDIDVVQRLYSWNDYEDFISFYNHRLDIRYDEVSSILYISFLHTDKNIAQNILKDIIKEAEDRLNLYNHQISQKHLKFVVAETTKYKTLVDNSIKALEQWQNKHKFLDPSNEATSSLEILASLQTKLIEKTLELKKLQTFQTSSSIEIINIKQSIKEIRNSIEELNSRLSGKNPNRINKDIFEYTQLKATLELHNELYKQSLLQLQNAQVSQNKQSKTMQVLVNPSLASSYSLPNKPKEIITILLIMTLLYGIISLLIAIIKDHKE